MKDQMINETPSFMSLIKENKKLKEKIETLKEKVLRREETIEDLKDQLQDMRYESMGEDL